MSGTYRTFRESEITPQCHTAREAVAFAPSESDPGERGKSTYIHASISGTGPGCRVVYHRHSGLWHCTNPEHQKAGPKQGACRHIANTLWWLEYDRALADWRAADAAELARAEMIFAALHASPTGGWPGWRAQSAALGDVTWERTAHEVAA